jgi:DNA-directed RNA polymerase specialized sigma24 family protein
MRGRKTSLRVVLTAEERSQLEQRLRSRTASLGLARRCRAILEVAEGLPLVEVARLVDLTEKHVRKWVQRFLKDRLKGLRDLPGRGRKPVFSPRGGDVRGEDRL